MTQKYVLLLRPTGEGLVRLRSEPEDLCPEVVQRVARVPKSRGVKDEVGHFVRLVGLEAIAALSIVLVPLLHSGQFRLGAQTVEELADA